MEAARNESDFLVRDQGVVRFRNTRGRTISPRGCTWLLIRPLSGTALEGWNEEPADEVVLARSRPWAGAAGILRRGRLRRRPVRHQMRQLPWQRRLWQYSDGQEP